MDNVSYAKCGRYRVPLYQEISKTKQAADAIGTLALVVVAIVFCGLAVAGVML